MKKANAQICEHYGITTYGPHGSNIRCDRRATMFVNGKAYCTRHGNLNRKKAEKA